MGTFAPWPDSWETLPYGRNGQKHRVKKDLLVEGRKEIASLVVQYLKLDLFFFFKLLLRQVKYVVWSGPTGFPEANHSL